MQKNRTVLLLILVFLFIGNVSKAQVENPFFSINQDGTYKFFFTNTFAVSCENRADYYCFLKFNEEHFVLNDSIHFYYQKDKKLFIKGFFNNGKKEGTFTWYYPNGKVERIGQYQNDERIGIWLNYYPNGKLNKEVLYENNSAFLKNFYLENGEQLVFDGEGNFLDEIPIYASPKSLPKIKGAIKDGIMDGKWEIYMMNSLISTEYFENKKFIKGISSAKNDKSEYYDNYYSSFIENIYLESLSFDGNFFCGMLPGAKVRFKNELYNSIRRYYKKSDINKIQSSWFIVRIHYDQKGKISLTEVLSNQNEETNEKIKELIHRTHNDYISYNVDILVPIVIENHEIYLNDNKEILLFRY